MLRAVEEVLEHRGAGAARVVGLGDLRKLLRVAEQDDASARRAPTAAAFASANWPASSMKRRSKLSRCSLAREQPRGAGDELVLVGHVGVVVGRLDEAVRALVAVALVDRRRTSMPCSCAHRSTSRRRFWIAAWLGAVTPTRRPAGERGDDHPRAAEGLAGARRALDGRTERSSPSVAETSVVDVLAEPPGREPRRLAAQQRARRREASSPASTDSASAISASRRTATSIGVASTSAAGAGGGRVAAAAQHDAVLLDRRRAL